MEDLIIIFIIAFIIIFVAAVAWQFNEVFKSETKGLTKSPSKKHHD